jgi:hypothetical protein
MPLARLISNTNRAINPAASDVLDVQENVPPQELFAAKCTPQGFLVIPKVVRVPTRSLLWTESGAWSDGADTGPIEDTNSRLSSTTNDFVEITIRARAFRLVLRGDSNQGIATITIDGSAPSTISGVTMEDGSAALDTIDTYRASRVERLFFGYKGLSNAAHTVRITVSGTKNAASSGFIIAKQGIEYVDVLADAADGVACNQVFVLPYGDREDIVDPGDTVAITYVGTWSTNTESRNLMGRMRRSSTAADYFEITFTGTGIVLLFNTNTDRGFLDITLDATLVAKRWTIWAGTNAHFDYPFPILGLSAGSHTVRVTVNAANESSGNKIIDFAGFFVVKDADSLNGYGGVLVTMGKRFNKTGLDTVTMATADASNPRKDLLVVDDAGVFSIIQGTAAAAPAEPAHPTDDRVPLAILTQDKTGILLQRLHPQVAGSGTAPGADENRDAVLRQVQDRRRGILSSFGEVPVGIQVVTGTSQRLRLPRKAKRIRIRKTVTTSRIKVVDSDSSPERAREFDDTATAPYESFVNVDGYGGKTVHLAFVSGTTPSWDAISVM